MKKLSKQKDSVFLNFFVRLFLMLIGPLIILTVACLILIEILQQQTYENNIAVLQNSALKIENTFNMMEEYITYFRNDSEILKFCNSSNPREKGNDTGDIIRAQKKLANIKIANNNLMNIQIYLGSNDILIDYSAPVLYMERYYGEKFAVPELTSSEWYENYLRCNKESMISQKQIFYEGKITETVIYNRRFISDANRIIFYLDTDDLLSVFDTIDHQGKGSLYVFDGKGQKIICQGDCGGDVDLSGLTASKGYDVIKREGREMLLTYYRSERDWLYVTVVPINNVQEGMQVVVSGMICLLIFDIVFSITMSLFTAKKLSKPIVKVREVLDKEYTKYSVEDLVTEVTHLVESNNELREEMMQQAIHMKTDTIKNIVLGNIDSIQDIERDITKTGIKENAKWYILLVVVWNEIDIENSFEETSSLKVYFENAIREKETKNIESIFQADLERTVILWSMEEESKEEVKRYCEKFMQAVIETSSMECNISIGGDVVDSIYDLSRGFFHAKNALIVSENIFGNNIIQWFDMVHDYVLKTKNHIGKSDDISEHEKLMKNIIEYVNENYRDSELSIASIADKFHFTAIYLSKLFKKMQGENISKYIENVRMERAEELIKSGMKISEVFGLVGYNSVQVFRRAWKRHYGSRPSEYKTQNNE